jgi:hypothetical protein
MGRFTLTFGQRNVFKRGGEGRVREWDLAWVAHAPRAAWLRARPERAVSVRPQDRQRLRPAACAEAHGGLRDHLGHRAFEVRAASLRVPIT